MLYGPRMGSEEVLSIYISYKQLIGGANFNDFVLLEMPTIQRKYTDCLC
jgi:hypothetical protein